MKQISLCIIQKRGWAGAGRNFGCERNGNPGRIRYMGKYPNVLYLEFHIKLKYWTANPCYILQLLISTNCVSHALSMLLDFSQTVSQSVEFTVSIVNFSQSADKKSSPSPSDSAFFGFFFFLAFSHGVHDACCIWTANPC